jgi:hypothetical protein
MTDNLDRQDKRLQFEKPGENPETVLKIKKDIYQAAMELALSNPSEFKVDAGENSYYSAMFDTSAEIISPQGIFYLTISMVKKADDDSEQVRRILLAGPDGIRNFFRMDVKTGKDVERDVNILDETNAEFEISDEARGQLEQFLKTKIANVEGLAVAYDTSWAETEISDESALRLLKSVTKVNTHPRYDGNPTLEWVMKKYKEVRDQILQLSPGQTTRK